MSLRTLQPLMSFIDFGSNNFTGLQTIGEEYCHLVQVDAGKFGVSNSKVPMIYQF